jgi:hypothetical protein
MPWDSRRVGNGTQSLVATVTDASGARGSSSRSFSVQNAGGGGGGGAALTASFTSPANGVTVSGPVTVGMGQTGGSGTITFKLVVDSTQVFTAMGTAPSASFSWNTGTVANGGHTLHLTVTDGAGRTATTNRTVTVSNGGTPPPSLSVAITAPKNDTTVRGTVWFTVWVSGSAGGSKTYTLTDGARTLNSVTTTSAGPVSIPWLTSTADNGVRAPTVTVREGTGSGASSVRLTIAN